MNFFNQEIVENLAEITKAIDKGSSINWLDVFNVSVPFITYFIGYFMAKGDREKERTIRKREERRKKEEEVKKEKLLSYTNILVRLFEIENEFTINFIPEVFASCIKTYQRDDFEEIVKEFALRSSSEIIKIQYELDNLGYRKAHEDLEKFNMSLMNSLGNLAKIAESDKENFEQAGLEIRRVLIRATNKIQEEKNKYK